MTVAAKTTKFLLIATALCIGLAVSPSAKAATQGHGGGQAAGWHGGGHGRRSHGAGGWHGNNGMSLGLGIPRRPAA